MLNPCDICLDEKCNGKHNCQCATCQYSKTCPKYLHPTIRITQMCTQTCAHCCFDCSPDTKIHMSLTTAEIIANFLQSNDIISLNITGGEFWCNPDWYEILTKWLDIRCHLRIVSNGDWITHPEICQKLIQLHDNYPEQLHISVSLDKYHTNRNVKDAETFLIQHQIAHTIGNHENDNENTIVPLGRGSFSFGTYSMVSCYCHNPQNEYSFMIDENGRIYKCPFGIWNYANTADYQEGGFAPVFKEFNQKFYSLFVPSCQSCIRVATQGCRNSLQLTRKENPDEISIHN